MCHRCCQRTIYQSWKNSFQKHIFTVGRLGSPPNIMISNDDGATWIEIKLIKDATSHKFGIGFIDENRGLVGTMNSGFQTKVGEITSIKKDLRRSCDKIRIYKDKKGKVYGYTIGVNIFKL